MHVVHGPWVDTWDSGFVEGVWSGPFEERGFEDSIAFAGTGGHVHGGRMHFAAGSDLQARLYSTRLKGERLLSNSLAFLLEIAGDRPDPRCAYYSGEALLQCVLGINRSRRHLPTSRGRVEVYECVTLEVRPDLSLRRQPRPLVAPPRTYHDCIGILDEAIEGSLANAVDARRVRAFPPVATLSQGYDASFIAAIAKRHGCTRALTFVDSARHASKKLDDSGTEIGLQLGMEVEEFRHLDFENSGRCSEAEFCVSPPAIDHPLASFEGSLRGSTLLTGSFGDCVLSTKTGDLLSDFRQTSFQGLCGSTMTDFRLRVGFVNFPPLFALGRYIEDVGRISNSDEMRPWSVGGGYDRPIARRFLIEEAGVPDGMFGVLKKGSAWGLIKSAGDLSESSREDFITYLESHPEVRPRRRARLTWHLFRQYIRLQSRLRAGRDHTRELPNILKRYSRDPIEDLLFHWGVERTRARYAQDVVRSSFSS